MFIHCAMYTDSRVIDFKHCTVRIILTQSQYRVTEFIHLLISGILILDKVDVRSELSCVLALSLSSGTWVSSQSTTL